jgi:hypothetical protein
MSKKLIAVAAAAALALSALVATPANSAGASLLVDHISEAEGGVVVGTGLTSTAAFEVAVPSQDVLRTTTTASRSALAMQINTRSDNAAVTVTSTGAVKLLTAAQIAAAATTTATGTQSISLTADSSGVAKFFAYTTSTSAGSITVVESGTTPASNTVWVKGTTGIGNGYKINASVPTVAGIGALVEYSATVDDMFGNKIELAGNNTALTAGVLGATGASAVVWNATKKIYEGSFTNRATAGSVGFNLEITGGGAGSVTAFGTPSKSLFFSVNAADLQAVITGLNAQIAALKADYNALAAKWNKRVASKKAPKKAVTLK